MLSRLLPQRRVLITAGPTWVKLDPVRHISNVSSGRTGLAIARAASAAGADVTLLLGPGNAGETGEDRERLRIIPFVTFDDLHDAVRRHVGSRAYDAMIHTAAVSDYRPVECSEGKISSGTPELVIRLQPTPKIVDEVKRLDPGILLVKFKLEVGRTAEELLRIASASRDRSDADLIVANDLATIGPERHPAWILDRNRVVAQVETTDQIASELARQITRLVASRPRRTAPVPAD